MTDKRHAGAAPLVRHLDARLSADPTRTVLRPFTPGEPPDAFADKAEPRDRRIVGRLLSLSPEAANRELERLLGGLRDRHRDVERKLLRRYDEVARDVPGSEVASATQRLLIGANFTEEYAFESVALFNPSVVRHPDQRNAPEDSVRFVLSLRGIGEGHLSSLTFREGLWLADSTVVVEQPSTFAVGPRIVEERLPNGRMLMRLACEGARDISETVIYPFMPSQGRGIEDVRLVEFTDGQGRSEYRGTFTAFSGADVRQGLIRTADFATFEMRGVEGALYGSKGMALFPRKVGGRYAMLSRQDNESVWLVFSDDLYRWDGGTRLLVPEQPWEFVHMGNCGSPIEIEEGFLVLTHGVGGVRSYSLGAVLLDREDPCRIIGRLAEPLLEPRDERDGYVPNVVYSCGALVRGRELLLPFAVADSVTRFAVVDLDTLVHKMSATGRSI